MKKELIVKDNALINASYSLSLVEQRLILLAIVAIREHTHRNELDHVAFNKPINITAESYVKAFGVSQNTAYETLKDACKTLFARQFSYQEPRDKGVANVTTRWVQKIAYVENMATVEVSFSDDVLPLITYLKKQLTSYELKQVANLTSGYAIRLYELLISWRSVGKTPEMKIEEFRQKMGVLNAEHPRMEALKRRVLEPAIAQINEHTDIIAEYEQYKSGRTITGFSFSFKFKESDKEKRPKFQYKNKFGNPVLNKTNPKMSNSDYFNYSVSCLNILENHYNNISDITNTDLRNYFVFLSCSESNKSKFGKPLIFLTELKNRGFEIVNCELVKANL